MLCSCFLSVIQAHVRMLGRWAADRDPGAGGLGDGVVGRDARKRDRCTVAPVTRN